MIRLLPVLATALISLDAAAWGKTGHRITGVIAEHYLTTEAKAEIARLFPHASLAEISTYADEQRSNPSKFWQKTASPWHYITVPEGKSYRGAPPQGDALSALADFSATLKSADTSDEEKRLALHFSVHIIADLHQPLHVGNGNDRGGNEVKLSFFGQESNLHWVWDSGLIDHEQLSYREWADWLQRKITDDMARQWHTPDPMLWVRESIRLRKDIYPDEHEISWDYRYQHIPTVKRRLQQAGVRIAAYLNQLFHK